MTWHSFFESQEWKDLQPILFVVCVVTAISVYTLLDLLREKEGNHGRQ